MAQLICEVGFPPSDLTITGSVHFVEQFGGAAPQGQLPFNIIQEDQDLIVRFNCQCFGNLVGFLYGHWHLGVHFERIGPGADPASLTWTGTNGLLAPGQVQDIVIPASHIPTQLQGQTLYRIVATAVFHRAVAPFGAPIAAFADLGLVQEHDAG